MSYRVMFGGWILGSLMMIGLVVGFDLSSGAAFATGIACTLFCMALLSIVYRDEP